jgi:hypothetical protein
MSSGTKEHKLALTIENSVGQSEQRLEWSSGTHSARDGGLTGMRNMSAVRKTQYFS